MQPVLAMDVVVLSAIIAIPTAIVAVITLFVWFKIEPAHVRRFFGGLFSPIKEFFVARREREELRRRLEELESKFKDLYGENRMAIHWIADIQAQHDTIKQVQDILDGLRRDVNRLIGQSQQQEILEDRIAKRVEMLAERIAVLAKAASNNLDGVYFLSGDGRRLKQQVQDLAKAVEAEQKSPPPDKPRR